MVDVTNPDNVRFDYPVHTTPANVVRITHLPDTNVFQVSFAELIQEADGRIIAKGTVRLLVTPTHMAAFGGSMLKIGSSFIEKLADQATDTQSDNKENDNA